MVEVNGYAADDRDEAGELESESTEPKCPKCGSRRFGATVLKGFLYEITMCDGGDEWNLEDPPDDDGHKILQDVWCEYCRTRMDERFTEQVARRHGVETLWEAAR